MSKEHVPVLFEEVLIHSELSGRAPRWALDATFGRGGHTELWLKKFSDLRVIALDRDLAAITAGAQQFPVELKSGRLHLLHGNFHHLETLAPHWLQAGVDPSGFDLILADLGVSSPQLDTPERGFSFYHDGPLDMRMDQSQGVSAADIVNRWSESDLLSMFQEFGEIRRPQRVVRAIVQDRRQKLFTSTQQLSELITRIEGWQRRGHHPATRYFLALRLVVNDELSLLRESVLAMISTLAPGGRLLVLTFHSLEDRIVKYAMREALDRGRLVNKKVIVPSRQECQENPRARSAKLRVFERS